MLGGLAWASRGDRAFASVEYPQQRPLAEWERKRARRRAELEEKTARRQAEFAAFLLAIAAQVAADVSAAVAAALQATRAEPLKELDLAPTTTTTSIISESSTSIQMPGGSSSISTTGEAASASHDLDLPSAVPVTCSTDCPRRDNGSSDATATTSASAARDVSTTCVLPHSTAAAEPEATIPAVCAKTVLQEGNDGHISMTSSKHNTATAPLDSTLTPMMSSPLASNIVPVMSTRCFMECPGDDTSVETPESAPSTCSLILKRLGGIVPSATTVLGFADAKQVIAAQLSDASLKHLPVSRSFLPERGAPTTTDSFQVRLLHDLRPLPRPLLLDEHHVGDEILLMPCPLLNCFLGGDCPKHPWPPPQMLSLMGRYCSDLILSEEPSNCFQCVHACCLPDQAKGSGKLFLFTENDQVDKKSLEYSSRCGSEAIQWEIAWKLRYEGDSLLRTDRLQICILALDEHLYNFSELSCCCCEPWTSWQLQFFISAPRIASSIYDLLISLKTEDELDMRPNLSLQPDILALGCCSIVLQTMSICSALQTTEFPCFLASCIQPGAPMFLGSDCYLLIALIYMQQWPVWEACFSFPKLQYYTEFGSTTRADQNKYRTEDYMESIRGPCFWVGTVGNACIYGSSRFQWYIAWSNTLPQAAVRTIHLARPMFILITAETLAFNPGMQFLLGGATVHYSAIFQLEIAWELEFECFHESSQFRQSLAGVSEVLDIIYAGINTLQNPWDPGAGSSFAQRQGNPEGLNDAWSLAIGNGYEVVMVRYLSLQVLVVLSSNGYVGRTTLYAAEESEWKIAWLLNLKTTRRRYTVVIPSSLETSNFTLCLSLIIPWDPGGYASSIGDMQEISLVVKCFNHEVRAANWQAGVHARHLCLPWDPSNSNQHRLEGKPDFKKGGLPVTLLTMDLPLGLGWKWAGTPGSRPAQKLPEQLLQIQLEVD